MGLSTSCHACYAGSGMAAARRGPSIVRSPEMTARRKGCDSRPGEVGNPEIPGHGLSMTLVFCQLAGGLVVGAWGAFWLALGSLMVSGR